MISQKDRKALIALVREQRATWEKADAAVTEACGDTKITGSKFDALVAQRTREYALYLGIRAAVSAMDAPALSLELGEVWREGVPA